MKKIAVSLSLVAVAACTGANSNPTAPAGLTSTSNAGANGETLKANAPQLVSPIGNPELADLDPTFSWTNASAKYTSGQAFTYDLEILQGSQRVLMFVVPSSATGTTTFESPTGLNFASSYTWRVRARLGSLVGPWSSLGSFRTFERFTCSGFGNNPVAIIGCHRNRYPEHMEPHQLIEMLKNVAWDFNRVGVPGGPFGVLVKTFGNNCNGYSCDILCAGQGSNQNQWDILRDEREPQWGNDIEGIRVDVCEIQ